MNHTVIRSVAVLLTLVCLLSLTACGKRLECREDGSYFCSATGVSYLQLPACYEPVTLGKKYAEIKTGKSPIPLYELEGQDPSRWLATEDGFLLMATDLTLPKPPDMNCNALSICESDVQTALLATVSDKAVIREVLAAFVNGPDLGYETIGCTDSWQLKFDLTEHPGVCFALTLLYYRDGRPVYDKLDEDEAAAVEAALDEAWRNLTEEEIANGVEPTPELPAEYERLTDDERVEVRLEKVYYTDADGNRAYEWDVIYSYGSYFLYDRSSGTCAPAWDLLTEYIEGKSAS